MAISRGSHCSGSWQLSTHPWCSDPNCTAAHHVKSRSAANIGMQSSHALDTRWICGMPSSGSNCLCDDEMR